MPGCTSCKWDGGRFQVRKHGNAVRFYSRYGAEYTERLPQMCRAFAELPARSVVLDGELVLIDPRGATHFWRLMAQMHTNHPDASQRLFLAFDLRSSAPRQRQPTTAATYAMTC